MFYYHKFKKLYIASFIILCICCIGNIGYITLEGYNFGEAFYMTIITISTVGYQEIRPLSEEGRYFTSFLIVTSLGTFAYAISVISSYLIDGELKKHILELRKLKKIKKLEKMAINNWSKRKNKKM